MADDVRIRTYNVGFGDCIYLRVPTGGAGFHMLIDCGSLGDQDRPRRAVENVRAMLPTVQQAGGHGSANELWLDLLVVTHPHKDHLSGFDPDWFRGLRIGQIWMSAFMQDDHPKAKRANALHLLAEKSVQALESMADRRGLQMTPGLRELLTFNVSNATALAALKKKAKAGAKVIDPDAPRIYVCRDLVEREVLADVATYGFTSEQGVLAYRKGDLTIRVLAPEWDIDEAYLGKAFSDVVQLADTFDPKAAASAEVAAPSGVKPLNVSAADFAQLRKRLRQLLVDSALSFSQEDRSLRNDTSVVLLLEWHGKRLLFAGDAEWKAKSAQGVRDHAWNVLLDKAKGCLDKPVDFWKVGHHGSINGTPFVAGGAEPQAIMETIVPQARKAVVVVSTSMGEFDTTNRVPCPALLAELGRRASNARSYAGDPAVADALQPQRTDLEAEAPGPSNWYIDSRI